MNPEDLASQSVRLKEEQLRREEEKLREIEVKVQREINEKRQELLARESQLKEIEARMHREQTLTWRLRMEELTPRLKRSLYGDFALCLSKTKPIKEGGLSLPTTFMVSIGISELGVSFCGSLTAFAAVFWL